MEVRVRYRSCRAASPAMVVWASGEVCPRWQQPLSVPNSAIANLPRASGHAAAPDRGEDWQPGPAAGEADAFTPCPAA
jgi:hypothetical protein